MGRQGEPGFDRILPGLWLRVSLSPPLLVWPNVTRPTSAAFLERTTTESRA
jgi:hypothetical protein